MRMRETRYDDDSTLEEARSRYFAANGFPADGGYAAPWVDFELGPIPMPFPNSDARRQAVKVHDLHHVLTGYRTDIYGEAEISAWELGAGCRNMIAAWVLNLGGMALGVLIAPRRTWQAWMRGRRSRSLYGERFDAALLARRVGATRRELGIAGADDSQSRPSIRDALLFFVYWQIGAWGSLALLPLAVLSALVAAIVGVVRQA